MKNNFTMLLYNDNGWQVGLRNNGIYSVDFIGDWDEIHSLAQVHLPVKIMQMYRKLVWLSLQKFRKACDYPGCESAGAEMHELINRNRTVDGTVQRLLTYQPELVSWLCRHHHSHAHNPQERSRLLSQNILRYGDDRMSQVIGDLLLAIPSLDLDLSGNIQ
jgi:hypothetical protein